MKIVEISIENYRNLDGVSIKFDESVSYIVGENNLGKTNVLDLLNTLFNQAMINADDFAHTDRRCGAAITLKMDKDELGQTGLDINPITGNTVTVLAFAEDPDSRIEYEMQESGEKLSPATIRSIHFFRYSTVSFNRGDLAFDGTRGVGKVLSKGIALYLGEKNKKISDFLNDAELSDLTTELNKIVSDVPILSSYGVKSGVDSSDESALGSLVTLLDDEGLHFKKAGVGLQYLAIASLSIIESIMRISPKRLAESLCFSADKSVLHAILAYDEPEAHLHPYMQRRLSKCLHRICEGEDEHFNKLLKTYFGIDSIKAQLILVTHSPNILTCGYKNIARLGQGEKTPMIKCGADIVLSDKDEKHLIQSFESIREAFFARSVLVIEGYTEAGAIPVFARNLGADLDDYGIVAIWAGGKKNVSPICKLLDEFEIPNYSIVDRDGEARIDTGNHRTTDAWDFEAEIIDTLFSKKHQSLFMQLLKSEESQGRKTIIKGNSNALKKDAYKVYGFKLTGSEYNFQGEEFEGEFEDTLRSRSLMYAWLSSKKDARFGAVLAEELCADCIPNCYKSILSVAAGL